MITHNGRSVALDQDNRSTFGATVAKFETSGGPPTDGEEGGDSGSGLQPGPGEGSSSQAVDSPSTPIATAPAATATSGYSPSSDSGAETTDGSAATGLPTSVQEGGGDTLPATTPAATTPAATTPAATTPASVPIATQSNAGGGHAVVTVTKTITADGPCGAAP